MRIQLNKGEILEIQPEGIGQCTAADGHGYPIYVEFYEGMWAVYLWEDINKEDYTDVISLAGAVETARTEESKPLTSVEQKTKELYDNENIPIDPIDALKRIRDYAWSVLMHDDTSPNQAGWIWAIARQALRKVEEDKA